MSADVRGQGMLPLLWDDPNFEMLPPYSIQPQPLSIGLPYLQNDLSRIRDQPITEEEYRSYLLWQRRNSPSSTLEVPAQVIRNELFEDTSEEMLPHYPSLETSTSLGTISTGGFSSTPDHSSREDQNGIYAPFSSRNPSFRQSPISDTRTFGSENDEFLSVSQTALDNPDIYEHQPRNVAPVSSSNPSFRQSPVSNAGTFGSENIELLTLRGSPVVSENSFEGQTELDESHSSLNLSYRTTPFSTTNTIGSDSFDTLSSSTSTLNNDRFNEAYLN